MGGNGPNWPISGPRVSSTDPEFCDNATSGILGAQQKPEAVAMKSFPLVSATGMLGSGFRAESLDKAIALGARMIGCDAGSTDPGPGPLAPAPVCSLQPQSSATPRS